MLNNLIFKEGKYILIISAFVALILYFINSFLFLASLLFIAFSFYFFRNPERINYETLDNDDIILCPSDGKVVDIVDNIDTNSEARGQLEGFDKKVSIFLSPLDVHVNWTCVAGNIEKVAYKPGKFVAAFVPKSSEVNERNDIIIKNNNGSILLRQIAGTVARRIVCWVKPGTDVQIGQKYGMIRFGSRVDILMPKNVALSVKLNQRVFGGQTILGRWTHVN